jgi:hypothetical protein
MLCCAVLCCRKKQHLVHELLQPEATFPRPTFLAANLATTPLDAVLLGASSSSIKYSSVAFDPSKPTLFTVEGLTYYLPTEAVQGLFAAMLKVAAPGSRVAFDFLHQEVRRECGGRWLFPIGRPCYGLRRCRVGDHAFAVPDAAVAMLLF